LLTGRIKWRRLGAVGEEMRAARLQELEELQEMAAKLMATAGKLSPSLDREDVLLKIGTYIAQITALKGVHDLRPLHSGLNAKATKS
jgi:hypothetical protein